MLPETQVEVRRKLRLEEFGTKFMRVLRGVQLNFNNDFCTFMMAVFSKKRLVFRFGACVTLEDVFRGMDFF